MKALLTLAGVLAALVVAAPAALGADKPQGSTFITDTLGGDGGPRVALNRFITDTLAPGGGSSLAAAPASPGFSWGDASIGAAAALGAFAVLLGCTRLTIRRRHTIAV